MIEKLVELIRETSSSLPKDVEKALARALRTEKRCSGAAMILRTILDNVALARKQGTPLCQDTGTLNFFVDESLRRKVTPEKIRQAVAIATERGYLRKNCLDAITGASHDDNCAEGAPVVHYVESKSEKVKSQKCGAVTLLMKGGGSENMSRQYSLPDARLNAGRDLEGVRKCLLDAVQKAQGYGCAPGILGVCIGGDRATGFEVAKEQLLRPLDEKNVECRMKNVECAALRKLERRVLKEANSLGIGPMGLGGKTTLLGVKIAARPRVPASFFVTVAYMCWAYRRGSLEIGNR